MSCPGLVTAIFTTPRLLWLTCSTPDRHPPSRMLILCSAVCAPEAAATGAGTPTCSWGEEHLTAASPGTASAGECPQSSSTPSHWHWGKAWRSPLWQGKLWISKALQEKMSKWSTVEETAENWEIQIGSAMQITPTMLPSVCCWWSWGEPTATHRDYKASWGWREERHSACLQPGADGRNSWLSVWLFSSPQYSNQRPKAVLSDNELNKKNPKNPQIKTALLPTPHWTRRAMPFNQASVRKKTTRSEGATYKDT